MIIFPTGLGTLRHHGKHEYPGDFKDGHRHGFGVLISHELYIGEFKDDDYNGFGHVYDLDGNLFYRGEFKDNMFCGFGYYVYDDNSKYIGEFLAGVSQGYGTYHILRTVTNMLENLTRTILTGLGACTI